MLTRLRIALALASCCGAASAQCLLQSLTVVDTPQPTAQGFRIACAGDVLVATSLVASDPVSSPILVWRRIAGAWTFEAALHPTTTYSASIDDDVGTDGQTIVVLRHYNLFIYVHDAAGWSLQAEVMGIAAGFTGHPDVDGDRIACPNAAGLRVLKRVGSQWITEATLVADFPYPKGFTGALSLRGNLLAAGAISDTTAGTNAGAVYVFRFDGSQWTKEAKLLGDAAWDSFGRGVAVDGDDLVVGATQQMPPIGYARFFHHEAGGWVPGLKWTDPGADVFSDIGKDVALRNGFAVVGMRGADTLNPNDGAAIAFHKQAGTWSLVAKLTDPSLEGGAQLGWDVALDGEMVLASSLTATGVVLTQGLVDVFGGLPGSPTFTDLGHALAGAATPCLVGDGQPAAGQIVHFVVAHALPGAPAWLVAGGSQLGAPFKGGVMVPQPQFLASGLAAGPEGVFELAGPWPPWIAPGSQVFLQAWIADASAPHGFAASNGLQIISD